MIQQYRCFCPQLILTGKEQKISWSRKEKVRSLMMYVFMQMQGWGRFLRKKETGRHRRWLCILREIPQGMTGRQQLWQKVIRMVAWLMVQLPGSSLAIRFRVVRFCFRDVLILSGKLRTGGRKFWFSGRLLRMIPRRNFLIIVCLSEGEMEKPKKVQWTDFWWNTDFRELWYPRLYRKMQDWRHYCCFRRFFLAVCGRK